MEPGGPCLRSKDGRGCPALTGHLQDARCPISGALLPFRTYNACRGDMGGRNAPIFGGSPGAGTPKKPLGGRGGILAPSWLPGLTCKRRSAPASWRWSRPPRGARNSRGLTGEIGASPPVAAGPFQHFPPKSGRTRPRSAGVDEHAWGHLTRVPRALLRQRQSHPAVVLPAGSETGSGDDLLMVLCLRESSTS